MSESKSNPIAEGVKEVVEALAGGAMIVGAVIGTLGCMQLAANGINYALKHTIPSLSPEAIAASNEAECKDLANQVVEL